MTQDTHTRTLVKTIVWRCIGSGITWLVAWGYTGNIGQSSQIAVISAIIIMITYYIYERIWNNISWARKIKLYDESKIS